VADSFHNLEIWKKAYELVLIIYSCTRDFPASERYILVDQLRRSSNGIVANIAESQGRYSYKDKVRVLYQARGEIFETRSHLKVAEGLKLISSVKFRQIDTEYEGLLVGLNRYIGYLTRKTDKTS
jgi:four helix bundle protein